MTVSFRVRALAVLALSIGIFTPPVAAQDVNAMAKWTALTVVHYKVVGEYSALTAILTASAVKREAPVTDRVEFEFDWNQQEFKLVGTPVIKNFPSTMGAVVPVNGCPLPKIDGPFELMTLQSIKGDGPMAMSGVITLDAKRDLPAGSFMTPNEVGCTTANPISAKSQPTPINFQIPPAMSLAMPGGAPYALSPDKKSLILKGDGWTWTSTPSEK